MSIAAKHAYRFGFLKSEEWRGIRLEILARDKGRCVACGKEDWSNDAHHLKYRKRWKDTRRSDAVTLCRDCHEKAHELFPKGRSPTQRYGFKKRFKIAQRPKLPPKGPGRCMACEHGNREAPLRIKSLPFCDPCWTELEPKALGLKGKEFWKWASEVSERKLDRVNFSRCISKAQRKIKKYLLTNPPLVV